MLFRQESQNTKLWRKFAQEVRSKGCSLLDRLSDYKEPVLVTGCQRSGTTLLARIIRHSHGFIDFQTSIDDELDAALILSGNAQTNRDGRYCFQTTYVNECFYEYFPHKDNVRMIWVIRNPFSVVWSMVHNWERFALNELYLSCGEMHHSELQHVRSCLGFRWFFSQPDKFTMACLAYTGKTMQLFELAKQFSAQRLLVVEYDDLILRSLEFLPKIYDFIQEPYHEKYAAGIHTKSISKFSSFSTQKQRFIEKHCGQVFSEALQLVTR